MTKASKIKTALEFTYIGTEVETALRVLQAAKDYGLRSGSYGVARLTQIIANGLGGTRETWRVFYIYITWDFKTQTHTHMKKEHKSKTGGLTARGRNSLKEQRWF